MIMIASSSAITTTNQVSMLLPIQLEPTTSKTIGLHSQLKDIAQNKGNINKKDNVLQQKTGVDRTLNMLGFVAYGKMKKAVHHLPLLQELLHRGCNRNEAVIWTFTECKKRLKDMEILRLANSSAAMKSAANKGFQPLSTAVFQID